MVRSRLSTGMLGACQMNPASSASFLASSDLEGHMWPHRSHWHTTEFMVFAFMTFTLLYVSSLSLYRAIR